MIRTLLIGTTLVLLTACSSVESESFSTINIDGREYDLRTRTMNGPQGSYVTHSVRGSNGAFTQCDPSSPNSCRGALIRGKERERD